MALLLKGIMLKSYEVSLPEQFSRFFVSVPAEYLSEAYDLLEDDEVKGEIRSIRMGDSTYTSAYGKPITLILKRSAILDRLFISKTSWEDNFREWGIVTSGYVLDLRLTEIKRKATDVSEKIYTKTDAVWSWV